VTREDWPLQDHVDRDRPQGVLKPGRNCRGIARARRAAVLVDACDYYERLAQALRRAHRSVLIVGWDFDGRIHLCPHHEKCEPLGDVLRALVEARPELEVRVLVWSAAVVHASGDPLPLLMGAPWEDHPRISVRLDTKHPLYASHHQKIVVIDDVIAFCGGIDLTAERWDTCGHDAEDPLRLLPDGKPYHPVHDVQMAVDGDAARMVGDVARERWQIATGETVSAVADAKPIWPDDLVPDFTDTPVAVACTAPEYEGRPAVHEIAALTEDLLGAARHTIYIENQYFAASRVRRVLEKSLAARNGPEIVAVIRRASPGMLERLVMSNNRDRLIRRLRQADRHNRLRVYYPVVAGKESPCEVFVHAKVLIVDDTVLRVGSANLNNRSMGLDTECDLVLEAATAADRQSILALRHRLLAEHLGATPEEVAETVAARGSLIRAVDTLNRNGRGLRPFPETDFNGPIEPIAGTGFLDPKRPLELL
jgi:phosphatidylserine/phosphatidylglycerophosphate/cardiolipin synthase-like enzyme